MSARDPIAALTHDHAHLSALVLATSAAMGRINRGELTFDDGAGELRVAAEALRDALLVHFAREEEGLFPFLETSVTSLVSGVLALRAEHDSICARVDELCRAIDDALHEKADYSACTLAFGRFEEIYAKHAQAELAFLREVDAQLDATARERLRVLLAET